MKILILNWRDIMHPKHGGAEYITHEHAKRWVRSGHQVTWFTTSFAGCRHVEVIDDIRFIRRGSFLSVFLYAFVYILAHSKNIDIIVDEVHGIPFFSILYSKKPTVVFIHEIAGEIWDVMYPFPLNIIGKSLEKLFMWIYRRTVFWTVSPSTAAELVHMGIKKSHCVVIPNPIRYKPVKVLPQKEKYPTFLFVGRLVKMKRIEDILTAFSYIYRKLPTSKLWIVGTGGKAYVRKLRSRVTSLGLEPAVQLVGYVDDAHKLELMGRSHMLLHASVKEGWGLVVLEASSQGTPSVAYNVSGLKDAVVHEKTGLLVQENTPHEMAESALKLLADKKIYRSLQLKGLERVRHPKWGSVAAKSLALLVHVYNTYT